MNWVQIDIAGATANPDRLITPGEPLRIVMGPSRGATVKVMRSTFLVVVGVLVGLAGLLFTLQGFGAVTGSPMTGTTTWSILGPIILLIGVVVAVMGWRGRKS